MYYVWNVGVQLYLIVGLTFVTFAIKADGVAFHRFALNLTLLFTAMALKFVVARSLPMVGYLTLLDKFVLANFGFLFMVILYNGGLYGMADDADIVDIDDVGFWVVLGIWIFMQIIVSIHFVLRKAKSKDEYKERMRKLHGADTVPATVGDRQQQFDMTQNPTKMQAGVSIAASDMATIRMDTDVHEQHEAFQCEFCTQEFSDLGMAEAHEKECLENKVSGL